uniref:Receptor ligand binding region domain-containing protein n=1 Tax=Plectus sambesii TaxID=2011161 RepID=A0A914XDY2_9BILA
MLSNLFAGIFFLSQVVLTTQTTVIKIGHIYYFEAERAVMQMAYEDMKEQNLLPDVYEIQVISRMGCALYNTNLSILHGVKEATDLYFKENARVLFGSPCSEETVVIGQMAATVNWNVPLIGYLASDDALSNKAIYSTVARTGVVSQNFFAQAIKFLVQKNGWKKVAYVGSDIFASTLNRQSVVSELTSAGVAVYQMVIPLSSTWQSVANSKAIVDLKANARVVFVMLNSEMNASVPFMAAAHSLGYTEDPEFVFVIIVSQSTFTSRPWDSNYDGMSYSYLREAYEGAYIIRVTGQDFATVTKFRQKLLASQQYTNPIGNDAYVMPIYDAVVLYLTALNRSWADSRNESLYANGAVMFEYMKNVVYQGFTGKVFINNNGDRIPSYEFVLLPKQVNRAYTVLMSIDATRLNGCDPIAKGNLCYPYNITVTDDYHSVIWPPDHPICGYRHELCDNTLYFILGGTLMAAAIGIAVIFYAVKKRKQRLIYLMPWQVPLDSIKMLSSGTVV